MPLNGVDADMLTATGDYFGKLLRNLDRLIEQAGSRRDNARKTARDQFWNELLAIWCELGGKPTGSGGGALPDRCVEAGDGAAQSRHRVGRAVARRRQSKARRGTAR